MAKPLILGQEKALFKIWIFIPSQFQESGLLTAVNKYCKQSLTELTNLLTLTDLKTSSVWFHAQVMLNAQNEQLDMY